MKPKIISPNAWTRRQLLVGGAGLATSFGCGGSTTGDLLTIPFAAGGPSDATQEGLSFTTPLGFEMRLTVARLCIGPIYFNIAAPNGESFRGPLVLGQMTQQIVLDVHRPDLYEIAGGCDGSSGHAKVAELGLLPPDMHQPPEDKERLGSGFGWIEGEARRDDRVIPFAGPLAIDKSIVTPQRPWADLARVRAAAVDLRFVRGSRRLTLRIDPRLWFETVDFADIADQRRDDQGRATWATKSAFMATLLAGIKREEGVYVFTIDGPDSAA